MPPFKEFLIIGEMDLWNDTWKPSSFDRKGAIKYPVIMKQWPPPTSNSGIRAELPANPAFFDCKQHSFIDRVLLQQVVDSVTSQGQFGKNSDGEAALMTLTDLARNGLHV